MCCWWNRIKQHRSGTAETRRCFYLIRRKASEWRGRDSHGRRRSRSKHTLTPQQMYTGSTKGTKKTLQTSYLMHAWRVWHAGVCAGVMGLSPQTEAKPERERHIEIWGGKFMLCSAWELIEVLMGPLLQHLSFHWTWEKTCYQKIHT